MARRKEEREKERARKGKHCWNLCKIRSSWTPRVRVLDIQRVFLTRYHPFLPFLFFFSLSFFPGCRNYPRFDASRIFDQSPLDGWINGISKYGNVFHWKVVISRSSLCFKRFLRFHVCFARLTHRQLLPLSLPRFIFHPGA